MIDGFIVIDKPVGITSHDVVSRVRRILGTRKVGHTGTLDPFATGVLPVAVNDGTKAIPFLDEGIKCYEAVMRLGVTTDTLDITGTVQTETDSTSVGLEQFVEALSGFTGSISQTPPMFSAIKQNGQPLYKLARKGIEVERKARQVEIIALELLSFTPPYASIKVTCSRGTYVRSLADDIGAKLGCGAVLQDLRRTVSGPFTMGLAVSLEKLEDTAREGRLKTLFLSPHAALGHLADIELDDVACGKVRHGQSPAVQDLQLAVPPASDNGNLIRLSQNEKLIAVGQYDLPPGGASCIILKRVFN